MSDITLLFEGKLTPLAFIEKEWANASALVDKLPTEARPLAQTLLADAGAALSAAESWAGTAAAAYLAAHGSTLQSEILNLLSGLGAGGSPFAAATQDVLAAALKLLQALVADAVVAFQAANPSPPSSTSSSTSTGAA
jgi:hypothetical protein